MEISVRIDGDEAILTLSGQLTRAEQLQLLREKINALLREGCRDFVVDLQSVSYIDSAGLGELVEVYRSVQREGAILRIARLNKAVADLTVITKVLDIFEVRPSQHIPDPLNPQLRDFGWELQVGLALGTLVIIGVMIALR